VNVVALRPQQDVESESSSDLVLVPDGQYAVIYVGHIGVSIFQSRKVRVDFRLLAHPGLVLPRWYRVTDYRAGRIRAPGHSDLVRELSAVLGQRVRSDRVPLASLGGRELRVEVQAVCTDRRQQPLAEVNRYSTVRRLLG